MTMESRSPVPNATLTTFPTAEIRTPSASVRVLRKTIAAAVLILLPKRFSRSW